MTLLVASTPTEGTGGLYRVTENTAELLAPCPGILWLVRNPALPDFFYSVSAEGTAGFLTSWEMTADASSLRERGRLPLPAAPCHAAVAPDGSALFTANYHASSVTRISLDSSGEPSPGQRTQHFEGSGPECERQEASHPHHVLPDGHDSLIVTDLGADLLRVLNPHTMQQTDSIELPAGSGPRHTASLSGFPGRLAVSGELNSTVMLVQNGRHIGTCESTHGEPVPSAGSGQLETRNYPSDIIEVGSGRVVLANRGVHSLALINVARSQPCWTAEQSSGGEWPLTLATHGEQIVVVDRDSDVVAAFALQETQERQEVLDGPLWTVQVPHPTVLIPL